jgi:hypothetical protein
MQRKSIAAKTVLTAVLLAVAIWTTAGSPPHHAEVSKRQFAGRP